MHSIDDLIQSIYEINRAFLTLAQTMLLEDKEAGMTRLGLSGQAAAVVSAMTPDQIVRLARANHVICAFDCGDEALLATLAAPPRNIDLSSLTPTAGHTPRILA